MDDLSWPHTARLHAMMVDLRRLVRGSVDDRHDVLDSVSHDFGGVVRRSPRVVVRPADAHDVARVVRYAASHSIPLAVRGAGLSQGGQSLAEGGLVLDTGGLAGRIEIDRDGASFRAGTGVTWERIVRAGLGRGRLPPVRTYTLRPTLGGTLSVGGIGSSSFLRGLQVDTCLELDLVTGNGEHVRCSSDQHPELFRFTLGGLGQLGIIVGARAALSAYRPHVRTWSMAYEEMESLLADLQLLSSRRTAGYLEGAVRHVRGTRAYTLEVASEVQGRGGLEGFDVISGVAGRCTNVRTVPIGEFLLSGSGLGGSTAEHWPGTPNTMHPWLYGFLPWRTAAQFLTAALEHLAVESPARVVLYPMRTIGRHPMIPLPDEPDFLGCGFLTTVDRPQRDEALEELNRIDALLLEHAGHRYVGDYLHFSPDRWRTHLGAEWDELQRLKQLHDPAGILNRHILAGHSFAGPPI